MKKRATLIVLDSVGIGALKDANYFGDAGAHTLGIFIKKHTWPYPICYHWGLAI